MKRLRCRLGFHRWAEDDEYYLVPWTVLHCLDCGRRYR